MDRHESVTASQTSSSASVDQFVNSNPGRTVRKIVSGAGLLSIGLGAGACVTQVKPTEAIPPETGAVDPAAVTKPPEEVHETQTSIAEETNTVPTATPKPTKTPEETKTPVPTRTPTKTPESTPTTEIDSKSDILTKYIFPKEFVQSNDQISIYTSQSVVDDLKLTTNEPIISIVVKPENITALHEAFIGRLKDAYDYQESTLWPWTGKVMFYGDSGSFPIEWNVNEKISFINVKSDELEQIKSGLDNCGTKYAWLTMVNEKALIFADGGNEVVVVQTVDAFARNPQKFASRHITSNASILMTLGPTYAYEQLWKHMVNVGVPKHDYPRNNGSLRESLGCVPGDYKTPCSGILINP